MTLSVSDQAVVVRGREGEEDIGGELVLSRKHDLVLGGGLEFWCLEILTCFSWSLLLTSCLLLILLYSLPA